MIVLDSSLLIAFKVKNDIHHEKAAALMKQVALGKFGRPLISDYIFDETLTGILVRSKNHKLAVDYGKELLSSVDMLKPDEDTFGEAWRIFSDDEESKFSFTDSTTIAMMAKHDVTRVGTFDEDFDELEGINAVR